MGGTKPLSHAAIAPPDHDDTAPAAEPAEIEPEPAEAAATPEREPAAARTRDPVDARMHAVAGEVEACGEYHGVAGLVVVRLVVKPDGRVESAWPDIGTRAFGDCVEAAIGSAGFAPGEGMTVSYPFIIR